MRELGHRLRAQGISFGVVGLSGTVVNASLVYLLHGLLQWLLPVAVIVASEVAILNNFLWNDRWTFGRQRPSVQRFWRFNLSSLGGLAINTMVTTALTAGGLPYLVALLIGVAAATFSNFTISTLWIWRLPQP
ncbi:MAG TPA: GtrA family protein [Chloroflexota bacterium]|nr:GtrA family protein [Chloroflexota bacterium]